MVLQIQRYYPTEFHMENDGFTIGGRIQTL